MTDLFGGSEGRKRGAVKGGSRKVPKGVAKMTPERRREISMLGVAARRKKKAQDEEKA